MHVVYMFAHIVSQNNNTVFSSKFLSARTRKVSGFWCIIHNITRTWNNRLNKFIEYRRQSRFAFAINPISNRHTNSIEKALYALESSAVFIQRTDWRWTLLLSFVRRRSFLFTSKSFLYRFMYVYVCKYLCLSLHARLIKINRNLGNLIGGSCIRNCATVQTCRGASAIVVATRQCNRDAYPLITLNF